ncbi:MAG: cell division protein ZapA [Desulfobacteraceae bacterium]|nr:cell division protein ZapA [Desulfobacteraceae bacterium]
MEQLLNINVLGQSFTFKSEKDVEEAREIVDYVVKAIEKVRLETKQEASTLDKRAILILTALNITNEFFVLKKRYQHLIDDVNERSLNLIDLLDARLSIRR